MTGVGPSGGGASGGRNWRLVRANADAVPPSVRRFMARARRRRLRAALPWAAAAGVLAIVAAVAWILLGTSVFGVRTVRVMGAVTVDPALARAAAAVQLRSPMARVDLDAVGDRVRELPPVARADVSRDWPDTIVVRVVERTAVIAVPAGQQFTLVDAHGVAFRTVAQRPAELPLVRLAQPGPADVNTHAALTVLAALSPQLREQLVAVSVQGPARIRLELRAGRTVIWGDETEADTKSRVATALLAKKGDTIDVSAPRVVTIR